MRDLIADATAWPPGLSLAAFFYLPALAVVQLVGVLSELPLYVEYRMTTSRRRRGLPAAPPAFGEVAAVLANARPATARATRLLVGLAVLVAAVSVVADLAPGNEFLQSCQDIFRGWWVTVANRAGAQS